MTLAQDSELIPKILAFNVGVELGQIAALTAMTAIVGAWRTSTYFPALTRLTNGALMAASAVLLAIQVHGYVTSSEQDVQSASTEQQLS